tara:strand:+ start:528 stop:701 length:174 start_codon:yes stop_codon:yes gene_type:complete
MLEPAVMCKIVHPASELYEIRAISDDEVRKANENFAKEDQPYRLVRPLRVAVKHTAA